MKSRILVLFSLFLVLWGALTLRAARLQVFPDVRLENLKRRQFETSIQIRTRRGAILDRNGHELAASVPSYSLFADPKLIQNHWDAASRLAKVLKVPSRSIRKRLKDKSKRFVWLRRQVPQSLKDTILQWKVAGLGFIEEPKRVYPNGNLLSQVMGLVGSEGSGLEGLELQFEKHLQGQLKHILLPKDARGRPLLHDGRSLTEVPDGADVQLTIDHEMQFQMERELTKAIAQFEAIGATGIVMDAQTSEVLAMATVPTINLNDGSHFSHELRRNRVIADAFESGSVMKSFVVATALKDGLLKPSTRYYCHGGRVKIGGHWIQEAEKDEKFEWLTASEILAYSSNVGTAKIALALGDARLASGLADFGFGAKSGLELPGEARGIVNPLPWRPHLLANISFGHGIAVTSLQVANAYTAIANGGVLRKPILVKAIRPHGGAEPIEFQAEDVRRILTPSQASTMRLMLAGATSEKSTGAKARVPGYFVAGKTGTAQKVDPIKGGYIKNGYISSFAGFLPADNPRYVIYVTIDSPQNGYYGSQLAAPVFARVAQYLVRRAGVAPAQISQSNVIGTEVRRSRLQAQAIRELKRMNSDTAANVFPDLLGLTLREALRRMENRANKVDVRGHGVVVRTVPQAGTPSSPKTRVTLVLENPD